MNLIFSKICSTEYDSCMNTEILRAKQTMYYYMSLHVNYNTTDRVMKLQL
jgi:hypothetical protein